PHYTVGGGSTAVQVAIEKNEIEYNNGKEINVKLVITGSARENDFLITYYKGDVVSEENKLEGAPINVGKYTVVIEAKNGSNITLTGETQYEIEITKAKIEKEWKKSAKPYVLNLKYGQIKGVEYEIQDMDGNAITEMSQLTAGNTYKIRAKIKDTQNYIFTDETLETEWEEFEVRADDVIYDPNDPNNPNYPQTDPDDPNAPTTPDDPTNPDDGNNGGDNNGGALDEILEKIKDLPLWQLIASVISIILIIAFLSKTASNESKRKKAKKVMEKKYNTFYATAFLGISVTNWTVIASVLMGVAVLTFVFMLISQKRRNKAEEELDDAKEEYARNREEMLYMRMSGNNGNMQGQGYAYAQQPAIGIEDMRGMINEAVSAMLPNVQQYLPQQASVNEELVQKLIEQNAQNEERIKELTEKNNETIKKMSERNDERIERFLQKLSEQKPAEKEAEREVAAANVNDEIIKTILQGQKEIMERLSRQEEIKTQTMVIPTEKSTTERLVEYDRNSEKIEMLMRNQEMLMQRMNDLAINTALSRQTVVQQPAPQIVEKVVEKPIEKVVEKEVRVEVPVEVEKIVEKEVVKEVKVEVPVVKAVPLTVEKPAPKAKTVAPRLTLDEAYAKLSAKQK
ncbi:MAG: hypothetical protein K2I78_05255, partial [Clostridia bacterium]|nr:hypothetical protein [Clostridia bacterium]